MLQLTLQIMSYCCLYTINHRERGDIMATKYQLQWFKDEVRLFKPVPTRKIDRARRLIDSAIQGKLSFCWRTVGKQPTPDSVHIHWDIVDLKRARAMEYDDNIAGLMTIELAKLRDKFKASLDYDPAILNEYRNNFKRLKDALVLLTTEGDITSFRVNGWGYLKVNWFDGYRDFNIQEIQQGFTFDYLRWKPDVVVIENPFKGVPCISVSDIIERSKLMQAGAFNKYGKAYGLISGTEIAKVHESTTGAGEIDSDAFAEWTIFKDKVKLSTVSSRVDSKEAAKKYRTTYINYLQNIVREWCNEERKRCGIQIKLY
jgi:hypothetical protein